MLAVGMQEEGASAIAELLKISQDGKCFGSRLALLLSGVFDL